MRILNADMDTLYENIVYTGKDMRLMLSEKVYLELYERTKKGIEKGVNINKDEDISKNTYVLKRNWDSTNGCVGIITKYDKLSIKGIYNLVFIPREQVEYTFLRGLKMREDAYIIADMQHVDNVIVILNKECDYEINGVVYSGKSGDRVNRQKGGFISLQKVIREELRRGSRR